MAESFVLSTPRRSPPPPHKRHVLVTGAAGRIGRSLCAYARQRYRLRLLVRTEDKAQRVSRFGEVIVGDATDPDLLRRAFEGVDTVVHLAANPSPRAAWETLLPDNIVATHNVFTAAAASRCRRVVFASSIHAVSGYPVDRQVHPDDPVNPGDLYGVSKCFGEALARHMAVQHDLSAIAIRIGSFKSRESARTGVRQMNSFVSHRDLNQLICRCIDDTAVRFAIFHGLSDNLFNRMSIHTARELVGYEPRDSFLELNRALADLHIKGKVRAHSEKG
jgi:dTDP-4-dehydrorhamnose reductase